MSSRGFGITLLAIVAVAASGSVLDVMEVDAAQYAGMARDMLAQEDWKRLYFRGNDYLDKPPMLFWLSALSFKLFGVHNWSYKLPSILFAFLGIYSTYRFTLLHYCTSIARKAAILFGTSVAFLVMTNDVRCDTMLTGSVITAIWLGSAWMEQRRTWQLIGCATAIAAGMLAKGPIGLMAPLLALGGDLLMRRKWDALRDWRLLLAPVVMGVLLLPMAIGLYEQHGAHGLRFFFWEQSFGRITGENRWKDDSSVFFFTHEVLWQLLPWTPFVLLGAWKALRSVVMRNPMREYVSISGALLVFIALSLSQFKLPHYLYVVVPLFAVLGAWAWEENASRALGRLQSSVIVLLFAAQLFLLIHCFREGAWPWILVTIAAFALYLRGVLFSKTDPFQLTARSWCIIALGVNLHLYPSLLRYQANAHAGRWAKEQALGRDQFFGMQVAGTALDFYAGYPVRWLSDAEEARAVIAPGVAIYTDQQRMDELVEAGLPPRQVQAIDYYSVQLIGLDFILPSSRSTAIEQRYLLRY
ncbi:MAG: glycosyltransferase family 39 protein [Flavobacteriales bacterium]|nr:glycosyltransferase family 39 protein [Flavobacteriales bacterium]